MLNNDRGGILKYLLFALGGIALVLAILIALGVRYTAGMKENAEAFFDALKVGNYAGAYALTSDAFRESTTIEELKARTEGSEIVGVEWGSEHSADNDMKRLDAAIVMKDGIKGQISVTMIKEGDSWRVFAVDPRLPEEKPKAKEEDDDERLEGSSWGMFWSTARITDAFMTRDVESGKVTRGDLFPADIDKIYCAVKLANVPDDTEVTARWIFVGGPESDLSDYEIGTATQPSERDAYLTFLVTRPEQGFPKGDYIVKLFINGKKKKTVPFEVE